MKKGLIHCLFAFAMAAAAPLTALSNSMGPLGMGAKALGAGGTGVATAEGAEAMFWNPAALSEPGWELGYHLGNGGVQGAMGQALALAGNMGEGLHSGLLLSDTRFLSAGDYRESELAGALAIGAGRWVSLGTVQHLHQADPGGLRGWSMDAGALVGVPLPSGWALRLGASVGDLVSSLAWQNGLEEVQPTILRLGLAVEARPGWWLSLQQDQLDRQGGQGGSQWRAGAQAAFFGQRLQLRAGATQAQAGSLFYTAGAGAQGAVAGQDLSLDYAVLIPGSSADVASLRQVLALSWRMKAGRDEPAAGISNLIKDPRSGKLRHARIALAEGPKDTAAWQLELKDRQGKLIRTFKGQGPLPPSVAWDGKDDAGQVVAADGISYDLRTTSGSGHTAQKRSLLGPASQALAGLDQDMADVEGGDYGLRQEAGRKAAPARSKALLRGGEKVLGADFDLQGLEGEGDGQWSLRIRDESGRTVKEIKGRGKIPKNLRWEGKDDLGRLVDVGLGATYEVRITDSSGRERVTEDDLVRGERLAKAAEAGGAAEAGDGAAEAPVADDGGLPASGCRVVGNKVLCTFHFQPGSSKLPPQAASVVEEAFFLSEGRQDLRLFVDGHAAPDEASGGLELSQARADAVMRRLVESRGLDYGAVVATGVGTSRPAVNGDDAEALARDRRVVLTIESQPER